jgi:protein-cysteine N-palmitoyltransferase HHAT
MDFLQFFRKLYSLDTLDTRFTVSATSPPKQSAFELQDSSSQARQSRAGNDGGINGTQPSKWNTPEFYFYYLVHLIAVPMMFKVAIDVSERTQKCCLLFMASR